MKGAWRPRRRRREINETHTLPNRAFLVPRIRLIMGRYSPADFDDAAGLFRSEMSRTRSRPSSLRHGVDDASSFRHRPNAPRPGPLVLAGAASVAGSRGAGRGHFSSMS